MTQTQATPESLARVAGQLKGLAKRIQRAVLRKAMSRAGTVALQTMRPLVAIERPVDALSRARTRLLRRSLARKVKVTRDGVTVAVIGPRTGFGRVIGTRQRGPNKGQPIVYDPARTAHLVDRGTRRSIAEPFTQPTKDRVADQVLQIVVDTINEELSKVGKG